MPYQDPNDQDERTDGVIVSRVCKGCSVRKPITEFYAANGGRHRRRRCKECVDQQRRDRLSMMTREERHAKGRAAHLRAKYDLSPEDFERMWELAGGCCEICKKNLSRETSHTTQKVHIDHDHTSGRVRGLLCFTCNTALGKFGDNVELLRAAIKYLEVFND